MTGWTEGKDSLQDSAAARWCGALRARLAHFWRASKDVTYGMSLHEMERLMRRQRADREHLFVLIAFGDILGVPILPPYYSLRLLPYIVPEINAWRRRLLREKDLTDLIG